MDSKYDSLIKIDITEHPVDQLAVNALQTSASQLEHWLAGWISTNGYPIDWLRKRCLRHVRRAPHTHNSLPQTWFPHSHLKGGGEYGECG